MQQIYRRTRMPKCDFNKVAKQLHWDRTSAWVLFCKLAAYFHNTSGLLPLKKDFLSLISRENHKLLSKVWLIETMVLFISFPIANLNGSESLHCCLSVWYRYGWTHKQLLSKFQKFTEFSRKHLGWSPIFNKAAGLQPFCGAPLNRCFWMKCVYFQEHTQKPAKHLKGRVLQKKLTKNSFLHLRCLTAFLIRLWILNKNAGHRKD